MYQIACRPGHRATEHLFVIKSIIAKYEEEKKGLLLSNWDIQKMFDKEDIYFCLSQISSSPTSVKGKVYRLLFNMNKEATVKVKTPVGMTPSAQIDPGLTQGSVEAAVISSAAIGKGASDTFTNKEGVIMYENIPIPYQSFMDDCLKASDNVEYAQVANNLMENLMGRAGLQLNLEKSCFMIVGSKMSRKKLSEKVKKLQ